MNKMIFLFMAFPCTVLFAHATPVEKAWQSLQKTFEVQSYDNIQLFGAEVRGVLNKSLPDLNEYLQILIDFLDDLKIEKKEKMLTFRARLSVPRLTVTLLDPEKAKKGQLYIMDFQRELKFDVELRQDSVVFKNFSGMDFFVNLPYMTDRIVPSQIHVSAVTRKLVAAAWVFGEMYLAVARVDLRAKKYEGVDWWATIALNLLPFLSYGRYTLDKIENDFILW